MRKKRTYRAWMWTGPWLDVSCRAEDHWLRCRVGKVDGSLLNQNKYSAHDARCFFLPSKPIDWRTFSRAGSLAGSPLNNEFTARRTTRLFACGSPKHTSITWAAEHWNKPEVWRAGKLKFRAVVCGGKMRHAVSSGGVHIKLFSPYRLSLLPAAYRLA